MKVCGKDVEAVDFSKCSVSVVFYNTAKTEVTRLLESLHQCRSVSFVYFIDNSPGTETENVLQEYKPYYECQYIHLPENPGFGAAHNVALRLALASKGKYHIVINPDVFFASNVIPSMISYMNQNCDAGMLMPQILNEDGSVQYLPKLLPSPVDVLMRKLKHPKSYYERFINRYELRSVDESHIYSAPILSGCFTMLRLDAIKEVGMYDERFFMYFEDWDLSRRMHQKYRTIYYPLVSVVHRYESGANKNKRLFKIFIKSGIAYFNKWGWFFDRNRSPINNTTLSQFK